MVKNNINSIIRSEKGSATAFVVMVSVLLSIIGLSLLSLSVSSSMMSNKLKNANERYAYIDQGQETKLLQNDGIMVLAYSYANFYVNEDFYESSVPPEKIEESTPQIDINTQEFFYNNYVDKVEDYEGESDYEQRKDEYKSEAKDILYFYFLDKLLLDMDSTILANKASGQEISLDYIQTIERNKDYSSILPSANWDQFIPADGDIVINVDMTDEEYTINSVVQIRKPAYENYNGQNIIRRYRIIKWVFSSN